MSTILLLYTANTSLVNGGGTEHVFVNMANEFVKRGYIVYAVVNDMDVSSFFLSFDSRVHLIKLRVRNAALPLAIKFKREINRIIPYCDSPKEKYITSLAVNIIKPLLTGRNITGIICYEHEDVLVANTLNLPHVPVIAMIHNAIEPKLGNMNAWALKEENKVTVHQVLMPDFVEKAKRYVTTRIVYIPNTIHRVEESQWKKINDTAKTHCIVTVGRLDPVQKQTHILIEAFHILADTYPDWNVYIYGKEAENHTEYTRNLQQLIEKYQLQERVFLCGLEKDVMAKLQKADIFAFPSAYEGFGLALAEALSIGLPAVGYASADGVNKLLDNGKNGILCENGVLPFAKGLETVMESPALREKMGEEARKSVKKYSPDIVWNQWDQLLRQLQEHTL